MWLLLLSALTLGVCEKNKKVKERVASLIVLPPLVLGYEDLYGQYSSNEHESKPERLTHSAKPPKTTKPSPEPNPPPTPGSVDSQEGPNSNPSKEQHTEEEDKDPLEEKGHQSPEKEKEEDFQPEEEKQPSKENQNMKANETVSRQQRQKYWEYRTKLNHFISKEDHNTDNLENLGLYDHLHSAQGKDKKYQGGIGQKGKHNKRQNKFKISI